MKTLKNPAGEEAHYSLQDYFKTIDLNLSLPTNVGPFSIDCRMTQHHIPTTAFRIKTQDKVLGYSADTTFDEDLISWLQDCDVIIHETNYGTHTPYEKLVELPKALRERIHLIHYPDTFYPEFSVLKCLVQGKVIKI